MFRKELDKCAFVKEILFHFYRQRFGLSMSNSVQLKKKSCHGDHTKRLEGNLALEARRIDDNFKFVLVLHFV